MKQSIMVILLISSSLWSQSKADSEKKPVPEEQVITLSGSDIVVTGTRNPELYKKTATNVEVISRAVIQNSGQTTVGGVLSLQHGVHIGYDDNAKGANASIEGLPSDYSLILLNGRRVIGRNDGAINLSRFSLSNVERIEIIRGAASAVHGADAVGGVVNIITRMPVSNSEYKLSAGGGQLNRFYLDASLGNHLGRLSNMAGINYQSRGAYPISKETPELRGRAYRELQVSDTAEVAMSKHWKLGLDLNALQRNETGVSEYFSSLIDERKETKQGSAALYGKMKIADKHHLKLETYYSRYEDVYDRDYQKASKTDEQDVTKEDYAHFHSHYSVKWNSHNRFTIGHENIFEQINTTRIGGVTKDRQRNALYLQNESTLFDEPYFSVLPGVRVDSDKQFGENVSPRFDLRLDPVKPLSLKAGYGWGYRVPTLKEMYYDFSFGPYRIEGNPNLKSERSQSVTTSAEYHFTKNLSLKVGGFYHEIQDKILREYDRKDGKVSVYGHRNAGAVVSRGAESGFKWRFLRSFCLTLGYTYTDAVDLDNGRPLDGQARHSGTYLLSYSNRKLGLNVMLSGAVIGLRPYYDKKTKDVIYKDAYRDVNVRVEKTVYRNISIFVVGENLTNEYNDSTLIRPPLGVWGGVTVKNF